MDNDRELIEQAAKAVGVCLHPEDQLHRSYGNWGCDTTCMVCKEDPCDARWSPLEDDGDALRLAVKLGMDLFSGKLVQGASVGNDERKIVKACNRNDDPYAATRRAIVRAAAEMAKVSD